MAKAIPIAWCVLLLFCAASSRESGVIQPGGGSDSGGVILGNFPNPFRDHTTVKFSLAEKTQVVLSVYDMSGKKVITLLDQVVEKKNRPHLLYWRIRGLAQGIYFFRLETPGHVATSKMTVLS